MIDRAGREYWDGLWGTDDTRDPPRDRADLDHVEQQFGRLFEDMLARRLQHARVLEIGCARSIWLPYLALICSASVTGIDYSEAGCHQARALLAQARVEGEIVCADAFAPPPELVGAFDLVFSFGVVEHFSDTTAAVAAFARFLRPGGTLVTIVPNMRGGVGLAQRLLNPNVFAIHVPLGPADLAQAYARAGLAGVHARHFAASNFGVVNLYGVDKEQWTTRIKEVVRKILVKFSVALWAVERRVAVPATRAFAGYVVCTGDRDVAPPPESSGEPPDIVRDRVARRSSG